MFINGIVAMFAACVSQHFDVDHADGSDLVFAAERENNLKKVAEALNATRLLYKMPWLHTCPNTWCPWASFVAIMDFSRGHIRD